LSKSSPPRDGTPETAGTAAPPAKTSEVVQELIALFEQKKSDGSARFSEVDKFVTRAIILLEVLRAGEFENLNDERKLETALLLDSMGIHGETPPEEVHERIVRYFRGLSDRINPELFVELERIKTMAQDRTASMVATAAEAFRNLAGEETPRAPMHDEKPPEDATKSGSLAQSLGWKVRI
jgi:hypothetical protein